MKTKPANEKSIREEIRNNYGTIARTGGSCCGPATSCGCSPASDASRKVGYSEEDIIAVPGGANLGLGCGNPVAIASLREGETVLDLGSGGGFDAFLAAKRVGATGRVIGVDMTPEMIERAGPMQRRVDIPTSNSALVKLKTCRWTTTLLMSLYPTA